MIFLSEACNLHIRSSSSSSNVTLQKNEATRISKLVRSHRQKKYVDAVLKLFRLQFVKLLQLVTFQVWTAFRLLLLSRANASSSWKYAEKIRRF